MGVIVLIRSVRDIVLMEDDLDATVDVDMGLDSLVGEFGVL